MNKDILNYIKKLSDNEETQKLLIETIGKILLKQDDIENFIKENENKIIHIRDWINSVVENNEQWKKPRVLILESLNNAADKYFQKKINKLKTIELDETHEKLIIDLGDYYVVQMLTPKALDNESKIMQHCIGHGGYDSRLENENFQYLSLRDKYNKAHVTLEIYNKQILQFQGKQNKLPDKKYLEKLLPWLMLENYESIPWFDFNEFYDEDKQKWIEFRDIKVEKNIDYTISNVDNIDIINIIKEKAKIYFSIDDVSDFEKTIILINQNKKIIRTRKYVYDKNIDLKSVDFLQNLADNGIKDIPYEKFGCLINTKDYKIYSVFNLPENCEVNSDFLFTKDYKETINLPNNLTINGNVVIEQIDEIPKNLVINGSLVLDTVKADKIPNGFVVTENLLLKNLKIKELPEDIFIGRNLVLDNLDIEKLPNNFHINGSFDINECKKIKLPDNLTVGGYLSLKGIKIKKIPYGMKIGKGLTLSNSNIKELPYDIQIGQSLNLNNSKIEKLPDNFTVDGNLFLENCKNIQKLPENLIVNVSLFLRNSSIKEIPENIIIKTSLDIRGCQIERLPENFKVYCISIDENQIDLIKETTNVEKVYFKECMFLKDEFLLKNKKIENKL